MSNDLDRAKKFVTDIHDFIVNWVTGNIPEDAADFERNLPSRLGEGFQVIMPGGQTFPPEVFAGYMRENYGKNPDFGIKIENVDVRHRVGDLLIVTYTEWQKNAAESKPANNGRVVSMMLRDTGDDLQVLHVHETWLPEEEMAKGDYSF